VLAAHLWLGVGISGVIRQHHYIGFMSVFGALIPVRLL